MRRRKIIICSNRNYQVPFVYSWMSQLTMQKKKPLRNAGLHYLIRSVAFVQLNFYFVFLSHFTHHVACFCPTILLPSINLQWNNSWTVFCVLSEDMNSLMSKFAVLAGNEVLLNNSEHRFGEYGQYVVSFQELETWERYYSKFEGWKIDALFTVLSVKGWINSLSPSSVKSSSSSSFASIFGVSSCLPKSSLCKNRFTLLATSSSSPSLAALPFRGDPRGLEELGDRQPRGDLLPAVLPLRVDGELALSPSLAASTATSDPPALIGGRDCLRGWFNGGRRNCEVGLSGRVGLINDRSLIPTSEVPSEEILRLLAAGERLSMSDRSREDIVADSKTCGVLYRRGKRGLNFFAPSLRDEASGKHNRFLMWFSVSASSFWIFFFSRSISLPIESRW